MEQNAKFVNDGSFLEKYKQLQEEQAQKDNKIDNVEKETCSQDEEHKTPSNIETKEVIHVEEEKKDKEEVEEKEKPVVKKGPFARKKGGPFASKIVVAKRPAESECKNINKKKKKGEEEEEDNPAWKTYIEEVKKYQGQTCSDDGDRVRPLVK